MGIIGGRLVEKKEISLASRCVVGSCFGVGSYGNWGLRSREFRRKTRIVSVLANRYLWAFLGAGTDWQQRQIVSLAADGTSATETVDSPCARTAAPIQGHLIGTGTSPSAGVKLVLADGELRKAFRCDWARDLAVENESIAGTRPRMDARTRPRWGVFIEFIE